MFNDRWTLSRFIVGMVIVWLCTIALPRITKAEKKFTPRLSLEQEYNDNWFRAEEDEVEFWVTRVSPGFSFEAVTGRSRAALDFDYSYSWHNTTDNDVSASNENYHGVDLSLDTAYRPTSRLTMGLTNEFFLTREPASTDQFSNVEDRELYWRNRLLPSLLYDIGEKGEAILGYRYERLNWVSNTDPGQSDSDEHRGIFTLTYHFNPTNHLDLESQYWHRDYDENDLSDYDSYQSKLIYRHEFNTYLSGEAGAGYQHRDYDDSDLGDEDLFVFHGGLTGATDRSKLEIYAERSMVDYTTEDDYFDATRASLFAQHIVLEALRIYAGGYYQNSDYQNSSRDDDTYNGYGGLGYRFFRKLFEVSLEYNYTERDSNRPGRDYQENRVFLRLDCVYPDFLDLFRKQ